MKRNLVRSSVVASSSLEDKEGYAVDFEGNLVSDTTKAVYGVVSRGRPADTASEVEIYGETEIMVDGSDTSISKNDPLTAGSTTSGVFTKASIGTDLIRAYAKESASSETKIKAFLA